MKILSIETSCDDTAAAIVEKTTDGVAVLGNIVSSQIALHAGYGGVVPNLAAREHSKNIVPVIEETFRAAGLTPSDIDLIAVTQGPGLIPALLVGTTAAKTLSYLWRKPLIGMHHIEGHIYANFISSRNIECRMSNVDHKTEEAPSIFNIQHSSFPLLALVVSGGHTQLMLMRDHFQYEILGETQDDAVGECFDKVARMLGLPYPGGPAVSERADAFRNGKNQISETFSFPRPMLNSSDYHFSFSGLKTSVLYFLKKHEDKKNDERFISQVCHEFQEAVVDVLVGKTEKAILEYQPRTFVIAGGVSANVRLRNRLRTMIENSLPDTVFLTPEFKYSLDNAAMIGAAAAFHYEQLSDAERETLSQNWKTLDPNANLSLL
ncbi:MAG: tRNA (adenosine(37)-N6)-threonylcarbamoyltransferase complex transferase subunit TsaD [Candidatus Moranbacteria bacterium]|nr:tRNA (adenosine(37)-N6)-threonylcarbamoyltransferase complex transferase subunit TsaD [Candidatus Moranbacteria bacterium]